MCVSARLSGLSVPRSLKCDKRSPRFEGDEEKERKKREREKEKVIWEKKNFLVFPKEEEKRRIVQCVWSRLRFHHDDSYPIVFFSLSSNWAPNFRKFSGLQLERHPGIAVLDWLRTNIRQIKSIYFIHANVNQLERKNWDRNKRETFHQQHINIPRIETVKNILNARLSWVIYQPKGFCRGKGSARKCLPDQQVWKKTCQSVEVLKLNVLLKIYSFWGEKTLFLQVAPRGSCINQVLIFFGEREDWAIAGVSLEVKSDSHSSLSTFCPLFVQQLHQLHREGEEREEKAKVWLSNSCNCNSNCSERESRLCNRYFSPGRIYIRQVGVLAWEKIQLGIHLSFFPSKINKIGAHFICTAPPRL